jgi:hypothetical protein
MSGTHYDFEINYLDPDALVDNDAKQINVREGAVSGPKLVPVIAVIDVTAGSDGNVADIYYSAKWGEYESAEYFKNFEIGKTFCTTNCPAFLFSNYLKSNSSGEDYKTISDEDTPTLFIGDDYTLKTVVQNLTAEDVGEVKMQISQNSAINRVLFDGNSLIQKSLSLAPVAESQVVETKIKTLSTISSLRINQLLAKYVGATDLLANYLGTSNEIRVKVLTKDKIKLQLSPSSIYSGSEYPLFVIKLLNATDNKPVDGYWSVEQISGTGFNEITGKTDVNGVATIQLSALNLVKGDKLLFTGYSSGLADGNVIITVTDRVATEEPAEVECLSVNKDSMNLLSGNSASFTINSDCAEDRLVYLHTDQYVSPKQFTVTAGGSQTVSVTGTTRDGIIGAYPLQVLSINGSSYSEVAFVDIIVSDSGCFSIDNPIIDLTTGEIHEGTITNNCFSGRNDNFYPQVDISTNSVALAYSKPGNPSELKFSPVVTGTALEIATYCYMWSNVLGQYKKGDGCNPNVDDYIPTEAIYTDVMMDLCKDMYDKISDMQKNNIVKEEPDLNIEEYVNIVTGKTDSIYSDTVSETGSTTGIIDDANLSADAKVNKASFEGEGSEEIEQTGNWLDAIIDPPEGFEFTYSPVQIGNSKLGAVDCHEADHHIEWIAAPRPPNYGTCAYGDYCWTGGMEKHAALAQVIKSHNRGYSQITALGPAVDDVVGGLNGILYTKGRDLSFWDGLFRSWISTTTDLYVQSDYIRVNSFEQERIEVWTDEVTMGTNEGVVYDLGPYDATPTPQWMNESKVFGIDAGDTEIKQNALVTAGGAWGSGFIPPEYGASKATNGYPVDSAESPYVEYDSSGMIKYKLDTSTFPEGVEGFLYNGHVYAVYNGTPEISSPDISISVSNNNLQGIEYALVKVQDWTSGVVEEKTIQVKLSGTPNNCYLPDGTTGFTGKEYSPRLLFNWDWGNIAYNQCDYDNSNYTYCDGTQFSMELLQKIKMIGDSIASNNQTQTAQLSSFYAYLIKDNYSQQFLEDFKNYYSGGFADTPTWFNSAGGTTGYDQFITDNKISFNGGELQYGGLYQVSIEVAKEDESESSIISGNGTNATITITIRPYQKAKNYNPFYETPFDGDVSDNGVRSNYGASVSGSELKLNGETVATTYATAGTEVAHETANSLSSLNDGIILHYTSASNTIQFNPSQPTPVVMKIDGTASGNVSAGYTIVGTGSSSAPNKIWRLIGSTIGQKTCNDFENQSKTSYTDIGTGATKTLNWAGTSTGTIELATTFFTPKSSANSITPKDSTTILKSKQSLMNASSVLLNNFDASGQTDYDTLKGVFNMLEDSKVCMSKNSEDELKIWWNPDYLDEQIDNIDTDTPAC